MSARIDTLGLGSSSEEEDEEGEDEEEGEGGGRSILPGSAADLLRQTRVSGRREGKEEGEEGSVEEREDWMKERVLL